MSAPRVLLADDEPHIRAMMKAVLQAAGCTVLGEARNGQEAVDLFRQLRPDLLLLDINMPVMTGTEALGKVMAEFPDALVVMLTSLADADSVEQCLSLGAVNYLRKDTPLGQIKDFVLETWREAGGANG